MDNFLIKSKDVRNLNETNCENVQTSKLSDTGKSSVNVLGLNNKNEIKETSIT